MPSLRPPGLLALLIAGRHSRTLPLPRLDRPFPRTAFSLRGNNCLFLMQSTQGWPRAERFALTKQASYPAGPLTRILARKPDRQANLAPAPVRLSRPRLRSLWPSHALKNGEFACEGATAMQASRNALVHILSPRPSRQRCDAYTRSNESPARPPLDHRRPPHHGTPLYDTNYPVQGGTNICYDVPA